MYTKDFVGVMVLVQVFFSFQWYLVLGQGIVSIENLSLLDTLFQVQGYVLQKNFRLTTKSMNAN